MTQPVRSDSGDSSETTRTFVEELKVSGADLVHRVRDLAREGNARRIAVLTEDGEQVLEVSLTLGAVAGGLVALSAPALAAIGALAALATHVRVVVTRDAASDDIPPARPPTD